MLLREFNSLKLKGSSQKEQNALLIDGELEGFVEVECIKCLNSFKREIKEEVHFKIVKPPFNGFDEKYDIIEQENFNLDELLKSEIELIRQDYNVCENCQDEFDKEF